jgi:hypothetical protein
MFFCFGVRFFSCFWSSVPVYMYVWPGALSLSLCCQFFFEGFLIFDFTSLVFSLIHGAIVFNIVSNHSSAFFFIFIF